MEIKYRIGYVDEDINQVKKYQRRFKKLGCEVVGYDFEKEMTLQELMNQLYNSDIDLLMIDYKLDESNKVTFNGEAVANEIYENKPLFPHIIFTNKKDDAEPHVEDWKIIFDKDEIFNEVEEDKEKVNQFINTLERSIEKYRKHIQKRKDEISNLLKKGKEHGLNPKEEDTLISLQRELRDLDKSQKKEIPEKLISFEKLEDLSQTRKEAEQFLLSLIAKNNKE